MGQNVEIGEIRCFLLLNYTYMIKKKFCRTSRILSFLCQNVRNLKTNKMTFSKYRASPFVFELLAENHEKIQI